MKLKNFKLPFSKLDWVFIISLAVLIAFFFFYFKRENRYATVTFKITDEEVLYATNSPGNEYATSFAVGDKEINEFGRVQAEIVDINQLPISNTTQVTYVTVQLKTIYNKRNNSYSYEGKKVIFGESFNFSFSKVKFKGMVVDFPGYVDPSEVTNKTVTVRTQLIAYYTDFSETKGVPEYVAKAVKEGDEVKNSKGEIIAKVLKVEITPAVRTVVTQNGEVRKTTDPVLKDVFYTLDLKVKNIRGKNYLHNYIPVTVDQFIPLVFNDITISPVILEIIAS